MLNELEAILDVALVCREEETACVKSLSSGIFSWSDFLSKLNTTTNNTTCFRRDTKRRVFEVGSRISLACMRCERASILCLRIVRESIAEVVVT